MKFYPLITGVALLAAGLVVGSTMGAAALHQAEEPEPVHVVVETPPSNWAAPGGEIDPASLMAALSTPCPTEDSDDCYWTGGDNGVGPILNVEGHVFPLDAMSSALGTTETVTEYVEVPVVETVTEYVPQIEYVTNPDPVLPEDQADAWFQSGLDQGYQNGYDDALAWVAATTPEETPTEETPAQ